MHQWGDPGVDWSGIGDAAEFISSYCKRQGLLGGQSKEKYGTVRFYAHFGYLSLHSIIYPGYMYSQFPKWLWKMDIYYIGPFLRFFFEKPFVWWQKKVYNRAYWKALKKWPHLRAEILCGADRPELIKGVTRQDGKTLHILGWNGENIGGWTQV